MGADQDEEAYEDSKPLLEEFSDPGRSSRFSEAYPSYQNDPERLGTTPTRTTLSDLSGLGLLTESEATRRQYKRFLAWGYVFAMAISGMVLVALGSTLDELAFNCGTTSTEVGTVFIARGVGTLFGATISSQLYSRAQGNTIIYTMLLTLAPVLVYMPFITSVLVLHCAYFSVGLLNTTICTGPPIMTRRVHGAKAGPWIATNTASLSVSGVVVPIVGELTDSLFAQYIMIVGLACLSAAFFIVFPSPEDFDGLIEAGSASEQTTQPLSVEPGRPDLKDTRNRCVKFYKDYSIEVHVGVMVFWLVGGKAGATAFLDSYVDDTAIIPDDEEGLLLVCLWASIAVGTLLGVLDQQFFTLPRLYRHLTITLLCGLVPPVAILCFQSSAAVLWVGVAAYGFFNGPVYGYLYDLINRVTTASEVGTAVVMAGLTFGSSIVPYLISWIWDSSSWPQSLILLLALSHAVPYPLLLNIMRIGDQRRA